MKAQAFAPGHVSGFFEPVFNQDLSKTGSRGAGINISLGALSEIYVEPSTKQEFTFFINGKKANNAVTELALKLLIGKNPIKVKVKTKMDLPFGQGFGMSAACALSATYALSKITEFSKDDALKASHFAEVELRTGLGDVISSCFGGVEIRKNPGLPPWGIIEHIPGNYDLVLCVIGNKLDTKKILTDTNKMKVISEYGNYCTKKILDNPSIENLFSLSQIFTIKTNLAEKKILDAINSAEKYGKASMCMLGNSLFAIGKTDELAKVLSSYGKVVVCNVDELGARII